jgi:hypothetical protein
MTHTTLTLTGRAEPRQTRTYGYLPFDVPPGTTRIDVHYTYTDKVGSEPWLTHGNTVDLGLIDERGIGFGEMGLRGWSGSARDAVFVALDQATPGYLSGPIWPGVWHVHLGFYKIAPQGCDYTVTVTLTAGEDRPTATMEYLPLTGQIASAPIRPDGWYRGELHCHTVHSDGDSTVAAVIAAAQAAGLDFLAITDHNDVSHLSAMLAYQRDVRPPLTLIPGCEMTTYCGHWNAWGLTDWVEFRIETAEDMRRAIAEAKQRGALTSCNHPRPHGPEWAFPTVTDFDCLEVWNGPWALQNDAALAYWESLLRAGRRVPIVGGSDMHHLRGTFSQYVKLGTPTTWVYSPDGPEAVHLLAAMRRGAACVSESPDGPRVEISADGAAMGEVAPARISTRVQSRVRNGIGGVMVLYTAAGELYREAIHAADQTFLLDMDSTAAGYVRAEVHAAEPGGDGQPIRRAISNPVYFG